MFHWLSKDVLKFKAEAGFSEQLAKNVTDVTRKPSKNGPS